MRIALAWLFVLGFFVNTGIQSTAGEIADIKATRHDGEIVSASGVVTARMRDCTYIEDTDRTAGIRLRGFDGYLEILYIFTAIVGTGADGEKELVFIPTSPVASIYVGYIKPFFIVNRNLGGGDSHFNVSNNQGQRGVYGCCGLNNIGLFIKTSGRVTYTNTTDKYFYIDDGSHRTDGSGKTGIKVSFADWPDGGPYLIPRAAKSGDPISKGDYVYVTGISAMFKDTNGRTRSFIRSSRQADIKWSFWGNGW